MSNLGEISHSPNPPLPGPNFLALWNKLEHNPCMRNVFNSRWIKFLFREMENWKYLSELSFIRSEECTKNPSNLLGTSINYIDKQEEKGSHLCQLYRKSLYGKVSYKGTEGRNAQNPVNVVYGCPLTHELHHQIAFCLSKKPLMCLDNTFTMWSSLNFKIGAIHNWHKQDFKDCNSPSPHVDKFFYCTV